MVMRMATLFFASSAFQSVCLMLQPGASGRPLMVQIWWTEPSRVPSALYFKRAAKVGPGFLRKGGATWPGA